MPRADSEQTHSISAVGFGIRFGLLILEKPRIDHKIMGYPESALDIEIISRIILTMNESSPWSKPHTFQSALRMLCSDHLNIDGPPFPVKCVRKFRSAFSGEVTYRCVCTPEFYLVSRTGLNSIPKTWFLYAWTYTYAQH